MIYMYCVRDLAPIAIDCDEAEFVRRMQSMLDADAADPADPASGYYLYDSDILQCVFDDVLVPIAPDTCRDAATVWFLVSFEGVQAAASDGDCWRDFAAGDWQQVIDAVRSSLE